MHADTVVVGAGSAGTVIAARATERSDLDVLLLEAGPDYPAAGLLPRDLVDGTRNSMRRHDWGYKHRPVREQVVFDFPRGRVVGGSSAVNTCIALRGQPYDYDEWAARGLPDWSFEACLPAFKRLENDLDVANEWHGNDGPVPIRRHTRDELTIWSAAFLDACGGLGFPPCADTNDPRTTGFGPHAMNKIGGERMSAARCYLTPAVRARENLRILAETTVRRLLFRGRRAVGLEVETRGRVHVIHARRVILSAGAVATPCILQRSGVGPRDVVERLGAELVMDLPVGVRVLDHPGCAIFLRPRRGIVDLKGPLVQTVLRFTSEGSAFANDMQLQPGSFVPLPRVSLPLVTLAVQVGKPRGQGRMWIESSDPRARPRIESRFLEDAEDRRRAVAGLLLAWRCARTSPLRDLASPFWPGRRILDDPAALDRFIGRICGSGYHPCGTAPMGPDGDPDSVVDGRGRVRGVEGLYIADASIMPTIPSANTNLASLMIGERFGEWMRRGEL